MVTSTILLCSPFLSKNSLIYPWLFWTSFFKGKTMSLALVPGHLSKIFKKVIVAIHVVLQIYLDKKRNPLTFRDQCYRSKYTGITSARPNIPYMEIQDDSKETYMESGRVDKIERRGK